MLELFSWELGVVLRQSRSGILGHCLLHPHFLMLGHWTAGVVSTPTLVNGSAARIPRGWTHCAADGVVVVRFGGKTSCWGNMKEPIEEGEFRFQRLWIGRPNRRSKIFGPQFNWQNFRNKKKLAV